MEFVACMSTAKMYAAQVIQLKTRVWFKNKYNLNDFMEFVFNSKI